jgi:amino acid adenylation domain-containing protein
VHRETTREEEYAERQSRLSAAKRAVLAQRLAAGSTTVAPAIQPLPDGAPAPLSWAQERLWFMEQFVPGTAAYTIPVVVRVPGGLDPAALRAALDHLVARHETLRSTFRAGPDGAPRLLLAERASVPVSEVEATEEGARGVIAAALAQPFDLDRAPLLRATLIRLPGGDHVLLLAVHHLVADGWSVDILVSELDELLHGRRPSAEVPLRYADYAAWQRRRDVSGDLGYWRERLAGLPPLDLPTDRPRPDPPTYGGATHAFRIGGRLRDRLAALARERGATLYMALLAGFQAVLGRYSGQDDFAVGSPVAGRHLPELEPLVGLFVNTLVMRADLAGRPSFAELLDRTRRAALDAYDHAEVPFERLVNELRVERDVRRSPLFQVVFAFQNYGHGSATFAPFDFDLPSTRFELELYASESADGLLCSIVYNRELFTAERIARLGGHLETLLEAVAADPHAPVAGHELLTPDERAQRESWNGTATDLGEPECLHRPVWTFAEADPDRVAVVHPGGQLRYRDVIGYAEHLTTELTAAGVTRGELVAVVMRRGWEQVVAVLAIHRAGAAYLPIDADLPEARRRELLELGGCRIALTQPGYGVDAVTTIPVTRGTRARTADPARPEDLAYVIFTSGSTGAPKGVMIEHRAALNTVRDVNQRFGWTGADRVLSLSALGFDLSVQDVYGTLATGGTLVMPAPEEEKDPAAWARLVAEQRITVWNSVPALAELLAEQAEQTGADLSSLRLVMLSGDWIPLTLPDRLRALAPGVRVVSLGGATEGSIWSICHEIGPVDPKWTSIPYGRPMANQSFHILDSAGCAVPAGVTGELHIGGAGVASGYWRDPERTAASFVTHPRTGERLYRTGDLGRYGPDGTIEFLGRADAQVKIRGYRVELGEIEAHLSRHPGVADCAVVTRGERNARELAGYVVPQGQLDLDDLRGYLADRLPAYMVPTYLTSLPRIPLTENGKVDRKRLPEPRRAAPAGGAQPRTGTERLVAGVWADLLGVERVGADDDFFAIGGHSLLAIKAVTRLRRELPEGSAGVAVMDVFRAPTVRGLAALLDRPAADRPRHLLHRLTPEPAAAPELSYVCVPYGGGSAIVYQPLADALPDGHALWSLAIPGQDAGLDEEHLPFDELAARCADEVLERVSGPIVLYGHCGIGSALVVELARRLEAAGRDVEATYIGAIFPFARPRTGAVAALSRATNRLRGDQHYVNWLAGLGVDLADMEPAQARQIVRNMRRDSEAAEEYFTRLLDEGATRLRCPIVAVAGERDPATEWYEERFREWHFLADRTALVVLDEAGHFFLRYRAEELAEIVTRVHPAVAAGEKVPARTGWWLHGVSEATGGAVPSGPEPSMRRFLWVMLGQMVSMTGAALTDFAVPLWIYLETGSLTRFAIFFLVGLVPGLLVAPLAGGIVDRYDRRRVMLAADAAALGVQLTFGLLLWTGSLPTGAIYGLLAALSVALAFQRLAFFSAVPQLVPKRYLGHANGVVQAATGVAQFVAPLVAVGLLATIGLTGILVLDVLSYAFAIAAVLLVRFPATMAYRRRETLLAEIAGGLRYTLSHRGIRSMLLFFAALNIFLSPLLLLVSPLVLSFADLSTVGRVAFGGGVGVLLGGLAMMVWGGPRRRRMRGLLLGTVAMAACCLLTGLRPDTVTVALGIFGISLCLTVVNAIYATIVQVTVPQRFHGRVFSLNTIVAWSTLPLGFAVIVPFGPRLFEPLMAAGGPLAGTVGQVLGTGAGRGIGLMYVVFALGMAALAALSLRLGTLARFDAEVPEAPPDDLYGLRAVAAKRGGA